MVDATHVRVADRVADIDHRRQQARQLERVDFTAASAVMELRDRLLERLATHEAHRVVGTGHVGIRGQVVDRHDARVLQLSGDLHLAPQSCLQCGTGRFVARDQVAA